MSLRWCRRFELVAQKDPNFSCCTRLPRRQRDHAAGWIAFGVTVLSFAATIQALPIRSDRRNDSIAPDDQEAIEKAARVRKLAGDAQEDQIFIATWLCWPNSERLYTALSLALLLAGQLLDQKPAVKSRSILTLRPPELSGRDAEHLTEVTRQVALVGKPYGIRNLRQ